MVDWWTIDGDGGDDIYLTDDPQITFFVSVYKRYTNFSIENIRQYFEGNTCHF